MSDLFNEIGKAALYIIIGIIIGRYMPKILDKFDLWVINGGNRIQRSVVRFNKENQIMACYRDLWDENGNINEEKLEYLYSHVLDEDIRPFILENEIPTIIVRTLTDTNKSILLKSISILDKIGRKISTKILVDSGAISKLIPLLGHQEKEIVQTSRDVLRFVGDNGFPREVVSNMTGHEDQKVAYQLLNLYYHFLDVRPSEQFLDDETIIPYLNYLTIPRDPHNCITALHSSASKGIFSLKQIRNAKKIDLFKKFLTDGEEDVQEMVLAIFFEFANKRECDLIAETSFIPIVMEKFQSTNVAINMNARKILKALLNDNKTTEIIEQRLKEKNIELNQVVTGFTY